MSSIPPDHDTRVPVTVDLPLQVKPPSRALEFPHSPPRGTFNTFHRFSYLPTEIRLEIWKLICHIVEPQVLMVNYNVQSPGEEEHDCTGGFGPILPEATWEVFNGKKNLEGLAIGLRICQESRHEALSCYKTALSGYGPILVEKKTNETVSCQFNKQVDTLFLNTNATKWNEASLKVRPPVDSPVDLKRMKHLAIGWGLWQEWNFVNPPSFMCSMVFDIRGMEHTDPDDGLQQFWQDNILCELRMGVKIRFVHNSNDLALQSTPRPIYLKEADPNPEGSPCFDPLRRLDEFGMRPVYDFVDCSLDRDGSPDIDMNCRGAFDIVHVVAKSSNNK